MTCTLTILFLCAGVFGQKDLTMPLPEEDQPSIRVGKSTERNAWNVGLNCAWGAATYTWVADFDGDAIDDFASSYGGFMLMHLSRDGYFENQIWGVANHWNVPQWTRLGDFNGDGLGDIASVAGANAYMKLSTGTGFSSEIWSISASWGSPSYT